MEGDTDRMNRLARQLVILIAFVPSLLICLTACAAPGTSDGTETPSLLQVTFLDVGQGDAILLKSKDKTVLIDAGDEKYNAGSTIAEWLRHECIERIDTAVITHPHGDHFGGFLELVRQIPIGEFIYSTDDFDKIPLKADRMDKTLLNDLKKAIQAKGIPYRKATVGNTFDWGRDITVELLHDSHDVDPASWTAPYVPGANDYSLVFKVTTGNVSYLLTGDLQAPGEEMLMKRWGTALQSTVLKLAHHGSKTSSSQPFLDLVKPSYAVIQVGKGNAFNHPGSGTLKRLKASNIPVFRTDRNGTMMSATDGTAETLTIGQKNSLERILAEAHRFEASSNQNTASIQYEAIQHNALEYARENLAVGNLKAVQTLLDGLRGTAAEGCERQIRELLLFGVIHGEAAPGVERLLLGHSS